MWAQLKPALRINIFFTILFGVVLSTRHYWHLPARLSSSSKREPDHTRRQGDRLGTDRPELHQAGVLSAASVGGGLGRVRRHGLGRVELRPHQPEAGRPRESLGREVSEGKPGLPGADSGRLGDSLRQRPGSGHQPGFGRGSGSASRKGARHLHRIRFGTSLRGTPRDATSAFWASLG